MFTLKNINIKDYTYNLPSEKIAKYPLTKRNNSKLLIYKDKKVSQANFNALTEILPAETLLVLNDTKVIQARLHFWKETGAKIEIFCLNPYEPADYSQAFNAIGKCKWKCIVGNLKKWKNQILIKKFTIDNTEYQLTANRVGEEQDSQIIEFQWKSELTFGTILENIGTTPIPPYLDRKAEQNDKQTYQTVYSKFDGSVAAPTAGLHFTKDVFDKLQKKNISTSEITLHVGAGTFRPVKSDTIGEHEMHTENFYVTRTNLQKYISNLGNITSVGTTSMRSLESLYWLGVKLLNKNSQIENKLFISQWEVYNMPQNIDPKIALEALIKYMSLKNIETLYAATQIIIAPGYKFRIVNNLITNFHQPRSTLLLLVAAFVGNNWKKIYNYALTNEFRFLSYGDSSYLTCTTNY